MKSVKKKPRIVELQPNIYQIRAIRPGSHAYLVKGWWKNILIDTGMADSFQNLEASLAEVNLEINQIDLIILTHEHFDHIGAAALCFGEVLVAAHRFAANKIQLQDEFVLMNKYFQEAVKPFHADIWLEDGMIIELGNYQLRVIHTPGHCSGSICLYEPNQGLLFTGDTVLAGGILSGICPSGSVSDYLHSLQTLRTLNVVEFYPGHGWISTTPAKDMNMAVERAQALLEESKILFKALDTKATFERLFMAVRKFPLPKKAGE